MTRSAILPLLCAVLLASCAESKAEEYELPPASASVRAAAAAGVVDSAMPIDEALERFRQDIAGEPRQLSGGADSREELVRGFIAAVEAQDTAALRAMVLSRAEFAYLYYPHSRYAGPPLEMEPGLVWFLTQQNSEKGITRVLRRVGGRPLGFTGFRCEPDPVREEQNLLWSGCEVELTAAPEDFQGRRLFGTIIERAGHFKLVSYANDL